MRIALPLLTTLLLLSVTPADAQSWESDIQPLLQENCTKCHGGAKRKGGLDLRSVKSALEGGENGAAIVSQKPDESLLINVLHADADPHMPPKKQLPPDKIETLRTWIAHLDMAPSESEPPLARSGFALPEGVDPTLATDLFIQARWRETDTEPAQAASDGVFVRRIFLDLLGRIPTRLEGETFLATTDSAKRENLIDRLTETKEHAAHLTEIFNVVFLDREDGKNKKRDERQRWLNYLRWVFETNRPWDDVGRDLIMARPNTEEEAGASWFLYEQRDDHQQMATRASATLLGKQVQCAQCHDHPVSPEIEQRHYWGLVAFFSRSLNVKTPEGQQVAERASGGYAQFSNLEGESSETELVMLSGAKIDEPGGRRDADAADLFEIAPPEQWFRKLNKDEKLEKDLGALPVPKFSRRDEFAKLTTSDNPDFSRAIVNRIWAIVFGRGLVHPVDQMDSAHPPSHPELLDWLARDFAANGHDVRRLIRALTKSQTYQLDSRPAGEGRPPQDKWFARSLEKPLSAEALYRSMRVAVGKGTAEEESMRGAFAKTFPELFAEVYSPSVQQAMFVTNGTLIDQLLSETSPLVQELKQLPDADAITKRAFLEILGRHPENDEEQKSIEFLADLNPDKVRQLCWALLASAEFRINH